MKKYLIHNQAWLYFAARSVYRLTPTYILKNRKRVRAHSAKREKIKKRNLQIMEEVFKNDYRVLNGPFEGMQYIDDTPGSILLPKILGSYEEPIQEWVKTVIDRQYDKILAIGCAEGYYAVGFAMRLPETKIIAYDINADALDRCRELARCNGVDNVTFKKSCDFRELEDQLAGRTLIFCDIEGGERELLDPARVGKLSAADMIIESHDSYLPGMTEMLVERFKDTHRITVTMDYPGRLKDYGTPRKQSDEVFAEIIDENRTPFMKFLFCESFTAAQKAEEQKK